MGIMKPDRPFVLEDRRKPSRMFNELHSFLLKSRPVSYTHLDVYKRQGLAIALPIGTVMASIAGMFTPIWASLAAYWEKLAAECNPRKFAFQTIGFSCLTPLINVVILFFAVSYLSLIHIYAGGMCERKTVCC